jgi:4-hydroxy-tetrahydrodipicolinate reductase
MDRLKVCIAGATGWVGRALVPAVMNAPDLSLVGAVSRRTSGKSIADVLGIKNSSLVISGSVGEALKTETDVLIDYTAPDCVKSNVLTAIENDVNVVVGTSGLTDKDYEEIDANARKKGVGVIAAGNFAISAALMLHFSTVAAKYMPSWEIVDYASDGKIDSPSGTANELAYRLSRAGTPELKVPISKTHGLRESRGANLNGNQVHAIRLPGYVIGADVFFGGQGERLTLKFEAGNDAGTYVDGTLLAAREVKGMIGLTRGLDRLLDL